MRVTAKLLRKHHACEEQVEIFEAEWQDGVKITEASLRRAVELKLDIDWFAQHFLPASAWKTYDEATAPAQKTYNEATAVAWKTYDEATAPAWKTYDEATAVALLKVLE